MSMSPQQIAGENARRTLGRLAAAATEAGARDRVRVNITAYRNRLAHTQVERQDITAAVRLVSDQQRDADAHNETLTFAIQPVWPTFTVTADAVSLGDVDPAELKVSAVFDLRRSEDVVRDRMRAAGVRIPLRIRSDETDGGRVQTFINRTDGESAAEFHVRMHEAAESLPDGVDYVAPLLTGLKIVWGGVR